MPKQKLEIEIDVPEGWRLVAYRPAQTGDYYLINPGFGNDKQLVGQVSPNERSENRCFIVEVEEEWRPATIEDVVRSIEGHSVRARFRKSNDDPWRCDILCGYSRSFGPVWISTTDFFLQCEVSESKR